MRQRPLRRGWVGVAAALALLLAPNALVASLSTGGLALSAQSAPEAEDAAPGTATPAAGNVGLLAQLRAGGVIVVIRHAATDRSDPDDDLVDLDDCSTQRNLTGAGRADARTIGEAFVALRIPVGTVWTSPYCRARETAELAFGDAEVIDGLERLFPVTDEEADRRINQLIIEQAPAAGEPNLVITGHGVYPSVLQPAVAIAEGEAAIYTVRGDEVTLLGRVTPDEWTGLHSGAGAESGIGDLDELGVVADRALDSVVAVEVGEGGRSGSGFRVAIPGVVVTSADLVNRADEVSVVLGDGTRRSARVLGRAPGADIAVLEVDDAGLPPLHSGTGLAEARAGDPVLAIGFAEVIAGTVRSLDRPMRLVDGTEMAAVETDFAMSPGSFGGPLINGRGEVIGVITGIVTSVDVNAQIATGFAIPVDVAKRETQAIVNANK